MVSDRSTREFRFASGATQLALPTDGEPRLSALIRTMPDVDRAVVIADRTVADLHADPLLADLRAAGLDPALLTVEPGDGHKSLATAARLYDELAKLGADRYIAIIGLGGGMVGDLAGFVGGTWMRGVPCIHCPTTLLAMVDASLGGKVAVNHGERKNVVGLFAHPRLIYVDVATLATLPPRDFTAGLAESVKHGVVLNAEFLAWQEREAPRIALREPAVLRDLVERNLRLKAAVVAADERETGDGLVHGEHRPLGPCDDSESPARNPCHAEAAASQPSRDSAAAATPPAAPGRAALNFGHTIGHALESAWSFRVPHGECVALGMVAAMEMAVSAGRLNAQDRDRVEALLSRFGLPLHATQPFDDSDILSRLPMDKKARGQRARFVLPDGLGSATWFTPADASVIRAALARILPC